MVNRRGLGLPSSFSFLKSFLICTPVWGKRSDLRGLLGLRGDGAWTSVVGFVNRRWAVRFDLHMCGEKFFLLITRSSMVSPMRAWGGLVFIRGVRDSLIE